MSFFEDASLVLIPSAQKTSKVYSVKPTDGTGDLTFTRSNDTATRVGPDGLIEKVRTNVLTYSNDFSNAAWAPSNATLTGGQSGYDGTTNGWKLEATATSCYISQSGYSVLRNHSIYAKAGTFNLISIIVGGYGQGVTFNLTTGAVVTNTNSALYSPVITSVGSGWYRISVGIQAAAPTYGMLIAPNDISGGTILTGEFIYIQAAQTEYNDIATDYIATTSAAVSVGPVANVPRLDYLGSSCPRLLLEPQRTNSLTYSEQFDNAAWTKGGDTILTANYGTSPDGYQNADRLVADTSSGGHIVYRAITTTGTHTISIFAKASGYNYTFLGYDGGNLIYGIVFNLSNGTISQNPAGLTGTIEAVGSDGWYRCTLTYNYPAARFFVVSPHDNSGSYNWNGNGTDGILIWGAQAELISAYASSYVNTLGAAVTRGADAASKTGVSGLVGATQGTIFMEVDFKYNNGTSNDTRMWSAWDSSSAQVISLWARDNALRYQFYNAVSGVNIEDTITATQGVHKVAMAYNGTSLKVYMDGALIVNTTMSASASLSLTAYGSGTFWANPIQSHSTQLKQGLLFATALTAAQLAELTA